ncbi:hypothetical protein LC612_30600 [Nostoc sp. CHAB 5834]|nr:hypothetical protein [Nostoc sp. CHAB 5834]
MLNRKNYRSVQIRIQQLEQSSKLKNSRTLRRFFSDLLMVDPVSKTKADLFLCFAQDEGFSQEQLAKIASHAQEKAKWVMDIVKMTNSPLEFKAIVEDDCYGLVSAYFQLPWIPATATLKQLQTMLGMVYLVNTALADFHRSPNHSALNDCPEYEYRNLPCSIVPDEYLWTVSGNDCRGGSGVLEWCYDKDDAEHRLELMQQEPTRFTQLSASAFVPKRAEALSA